MACVVVARGRPVAHLRGIRSRRGRGCGVGDGKGCRGSGVGRRSLGGRGGQLLGPGVLVGLLSALVVLPGVVGVAGRVGAPRIGAAGGVSPFIGVALGVTAGVSLDIALIRSAVVREHSLLPLLEGVTSVVYPSQTRVEHACRIDERTPTSLNTMISPSTVQALSAVRAEGLQARGGGE